MIDILLNIEEQEALAECSLEARSLYVLGLRSRMDISSGMVGTRSAVSYFSLATDIQYKPPLGSKRPGFFPNLRRCVLCWTSSNAWGWPSAIHSLPRMKSSLLFCYAWQLADSHVLWMSVR